MVNLQGSMQILIVKTYIYTTEYSTHYKASIQGGFLHAPRDPSPNRIVRIFGKQLLLRNKTETRAVASAESRK